MNAQNGWKGVASMLHEQHKEARTRALTDAHGKDAQQN